MKRHPFAVALLLSGVLAGLSGCTSSDEPDSQPGQRPADRDDGGRTRALELSPCDGDDLPDGFGCGELTVPLDHADPGGRTLALPVIVQDGAADAPVLLNLTGGPGQPGVPFAGAFAEGMGPVLEGRRLVMFDQRGTGGTAIDCPGLQAEMGWNDLTRASEAGSRRMLGPPRSRPGVLRHPGHGRRHRAAAGGARRRHHDGRRHVVRQLRRLALCRDLPRSRRPPDPRLGRAAHLDRRRHPAARQHPRRTASAADGLPGDELRDRPAGRPRDPDRQRRRRPGTDEPDGR